MAASEPVGAGYSIKSTIPNQEPTEQKSSFVMPSVIKRPPAQPQPGMDQP